MDLKEMFYSKSGHAFIFICACLIYMTIEANALPSGQGKHGRNNKRSVRRMSRDQRSADSFDSILPATVNMQTLKNASIMVCTEAMAQPYARMVNLNDDHMRALLQDKGGNYVKDYMAVTQEEAQENFPNMLILTRPLQDSDGVTSFSLADNLVTKQMIINDLNKLTAYLKKNETQSVDTKHPLSGTLNQNETLTTKRTFTSEKIPTESNSSGVKTTSSTSIETSTPTIHSVSNLSKFDTSKYISTKPNLGTTAKNIFNSAQNVSSTNSAAYILTTPTIKQTSSPSEFKFSNSDSTSSPPLTSVDTQNVFTSSKRTTVTDQMAYASTPRYSSSIPMGTKPTTPTYSSTLDSNGDVTTPATKDKSVTMATKTTTLDPDVAKSIKGLQNYVQSSSSHLGKRDLETIWKGANITLDPATLIGLVTGNTRVKRHAEGSYSQEEYCQTKGSLTADHKFVHLCSICAVTTKLPDYMFPRYINEAVCKTGDTDCFTIAGTSHGQCKQTTFSLNMLRRKVGHCNMIIHGGESLVFDNWELVPHLINVSCECTINKLSVFSKYAGHNVPLG